MNLKKLIKKIITIVIVISIIVMQSSVLVEARAGGHSSHSSHSSSHSSKSYRSNKNNSSGRSIFRNNRSHTHFINNGRGGVGKFIFSRIIKIILIIIFIILICIIISKLKKRNRFKGAHSVKKLDSKSVETVLYLGNIYSLEQLKERVEEVYFSVQNAWCNRDMTFSKEQMSLQLYNEYSGRVNEMINEDEENVLEEIELLDVKLESVCTDIMNPFIVVKIKGSMIDYWQVYSTKIVKKGRVNKKTKFVEYWKFVVDNNKFVLDKII